MAFNDCGSSVPSVIDSYSTDDTPTIPTGLTLLTAECNELTFTWGDPGNTTEYTVELLDNAMASLGTQDVTTNEATFTLLTQATNYNVRVLAENDCGSSGYSAPVSASTLDIPGASTTVDAPLASATCNGFDVTWAATADAANYRVEVLSSFRQFCIGYNHLISSRNGYYLYDSKRGNRILLPSNGCK